MLILTRKFNESIIIDGRIAVKILRIDNDQVKLGIVAPKEVVVHRWEIFEAIQSGRQRRERPADPKKVVPSPVRMENGHTLSVIGPAAPQPVRYAGIGQ